VGLQVARAQIDHADRRVQQPGVGIPLLNGCGQFAVLAGEGDDGGSRFGACDACGDALVVALGAGLAAYGAREVEHLAGLIGGAMGYG